MAEVLTPENPDVAAQVRGGDRTAIQTAVEAYLSQILRAARGAGLAPQEAEDVTQATFTTFIESAPRFEGRSSVRTWLFGVLSKKIAEARRAGQRDRQHEEIDEAFERRFDARGQWSTPPRPVDTVLHQKAVETEIFNCLDAALLRQSLAFTGPPRSSGPTRSGSADRRPRNSCPIRVPFCALASWTCS